MIGLIARVLAAIRIVCPSAGDLAASSMPIIWPAPGRLSTTNCWPSDSESLCATERAMMSVPPPAAEGTMKRTGFAGYAVWAAAPSDNRANRKSEGVPSGGMRRPFFRALEWRRRERILVRAVPCRKLARTARAGRARRAGPSCVLGAFQERLISLLDLPRPFLRLQALGDVGHHAQARRLAVEFQIERNDLDVDQLAALLSVQPFPVPVRTALILESLQQLGDFLGRADLVGGHREELLPRVAVVPHRGVVDGEERERLRIDHPHGVRMDIEQGAVARLAVLKRLLRAHLLGHVLADPPVSGKPAVAVEDRLAAVAQIAHLSGLAAPQKHKVVKRLAPFQHGPVPLPHRFGKRTQVGKFPAGPADHGFRVEKPFLKPGDTEEAQLCVLLPVPVGAHFDHAPEAVLAFAGRFLRLHVRGHVVNERRAALRRTGAVTDDRDHDADRDQLSVLADVALVERLVRRIAGKKALAETLARLDVLRMGDVLKSHLQQLLGAVTDHRAQRAVHPQEAAGERGHGYSGRLLIEERVEQLIVRIAVLRLSIWRHG